MENGLDTLAMFEHAENSPKAPDHGGHSRPGGKRQKTAKVLEPSDSSSIHEPSYIAKNRELAKTDQSLLTMANIRDPTAEL